MEGESQRLSSSSLTFEVFFYFSPPSNEMRGREHFSSLLDDTMETERNEREREKRVSQYIYMWSLYTI